MMQKGITLTTLAASSAGAAGTGGMCTDRKGSQTSPEAGAVSLSAGAAGVSRGASPSASPPSSPSGGDADTDSAVTTASPSKSSVSGATTIAAKMGVAIARDSQRSESTATSALKRAAGADASVPTDARTSPVRSPSGTSAAAKAAIATAAAAAAAQKNTRAAAVAVAAAASSPPLSKSPTPFAAAAALPVKRKPGRPSKASVAAAAAAAAEAKAARGLAEAAAESETGRRASKRERKVVDIFDPGPFREEGDSADDSDGHDGECKVCSEGGRLLLCDEKGCRNVFHMKCAGLKKTPLNDWTCPICIRMKNATHRTRHTTGARQIMSFRPERHRAEKGLRNANGIVANLTTSPYSSYHHDHHNGRSDSPDLGDDGEPRRRGRPKGSKNKSTLAAEAAEAARLERERLKLEREQERERLKEANREHRGRPRGSKNKATLAAEAAAAAAAAREKAKADRAAARKAAAAAAAAAAAQPESTSGGSSSENDSDEDDSVHDPYILGQRFPPLKPVVGMDIEAVDATGYWYAGTVKAVDTKARKVLVHYNGWSRRHDMWHPRDTPKIREIGSSPIKMPAPRGPRPAEPSTTTAATTATPAAAKPHLKKKSHHKKKESPAAAVASPTTSALPSTSILTSSRAHLQRNAGKRASPSPTPTGSGGNISPGSGSKRVRTGTATANASFDADAETAKPSATLLYGKGDEDYTGHFADEGAAGAGAAADVDEDEDESVGAWTMSQTLLKQARVLLSKRGASGDHQWQQQQHQRPGKGRTWSTTGSVDAAAGPGRGRGGRRRTVSESNKDGVSRISQQGTHGNNRSRKASIVSDIGDVILDASMAPLRIRPLEVKEILTPTFRKSSSRTTSATMSPGSDTSSPFSPMSPLGLGSSRRFLGADSPLSQSLPANWGLGNLTAGGGAGSPAVSSPAISNIDSPGGVFLPLATSVQSPLSATPGGSTVLDLSAASATSGFIPGGSGGSAASGYAGGPAEDTSDAAYEMRHKQLEVSEQTRYLVVCEQTTGARGGRGNARPENVSPGAASGSSISGGRNKPVEHTVQQMVADDGEPLIGERLSSASPLRWKGVKQWRPRTFPLNEKYKAILHASLPPCAPTYKLPTDETATVPGLHLKEKKSKKDRKRSSSYSHSHSRGSSLSSSGGLVLKLKIKLGVPPSTPPADPLSPSLAETSDETLVLNEGGGQAEMEVEVGAGVGAGAEVETEARKEEVSGTIRVLGGSAGMSSSAAAIANAALADAAAAVAVANGTAEIDTAVVVTHEEDAGEEGAPAPMEVAADIPGTGANDIKPEPAAVPVAEVGVQQDDDADAAIAAAAVETVVAAATAATAAASATPAAASTTTAAESVNEHVKAELAAVVAATAATLSAKTTTPSCSPPPQTAKAAGPGGGAAEAGNRPCVVKSQRPGIAVSKEDVMVAENVAVDALLRAAAANDIAAAAVAVSGAGAGAMDVGEDDATPASSVASPAMTAVTSVGTTGPAPKVAPATAAILSSAQLLACGQDKDAHHNTPKHTTVTAVEEPSGPASKLLPASEYTPAGTAV